MLPVTDRELYDAAKLVIDRHGEAAYSYARHRIEELRDIGDIIGEETWRCIAAAVEVLAATKPADGEQVH